MDRDPYADQFERFLKLKRLHDRMLWLILPAYFVCGIIVLGANEVFGFHLSPFPLGVLGMIVLQGVYMRLCVFTCPRCQKPFSGNWTDKADLDAPRCAHCGLPKPNADIR